MSKPASKTLIGVFLLGALVLSLAALVVFGSGKFFSEKLPFVMYFEGSVAGLNVGSPVMFRGVKIGTVTNIILRFNPKNASFLIPVYGELDSSKIESEPTTDGKSDDEYAEILIRKGLKARLELQSMITGQLVIDLDFYPDKPVRRLGIDKKSLEIPTTPSDFEVLMKTVREIPIKEISLKLVRAIDSLNQTISSPHIASSLEAISGAVKEAQQLIKTVNGEIKPLLANITNTSESIRNFAENSERIPEETERTLKSAKRAIEEAEKVLVAARSIASENSSIVVHTDYVLQEVANAARSINFLAEYLQRHPEAILQGKKP